MLSREAILGAGNTPKPEDQDILPNPHALVKEEKESAKHAELGASGAYRWMKCAGSINLSKRAVPDPDKPVKPNKYAYEGSLAHAVAGYCLTHNVELEDFYDADLIEKEMLDALSLYVDHCNVRMGNVPNGQYYIEQQFDLSPLNPPGEMFGTADFIHYDPDESRIEIVDLKYGKGVSCLCQK